MPALTDRQQVFVREYLIDLNGTQAAIRAGYSPKTANEQAARLLAKASVSEAIQAGQATRAASAGVSAERVVQELAHLSFYDPAALTKTPITKPEDIANLPENVRRAIIGWEYDAKGNFKIKLSPKTPSLDLLARHLGMLKDKLQIGGIEGSPPIQIYIPDNSRDK